MFRNFFSSKHPIMSEQSFGKRIHKKTCFKTTKKQKKYCHIFLLPVQKLETSSSKFQISGIYIYIYLSACRFSLPNYRNLCVFFPHGNSHQGTKSLWALKLVASEIRGILNFWWEEIRRTTLGCFKNPINNGKINITTDQLVSRIFSPSTVVHLYSIYKFKKKFNDIPVVPHEAVAEVSKIGNV